MDIDKDPGNPDRYIVRYEGNTYSVTAPNVTFLGEFLLEPDSSMDGCGDDVSYLFYHCLIIAYTSWPLNQLIHSKIRQITQQNSFKQLQTSDVLSESSLTPKAS